MSAARQTHESAHGGFLDRGQIRGLWNTIAPQLEAVRGFDDYYTVEWVWNEIEQGRYQVWAFADEGDGEPRLIIITRVVQFPKRNVLEVTWAFGRDFRRYLEIGGLMFDRFAEMQGCDKVVFKGRRGWERMLKDQGLMEEGTVFSRPIGARRRH